MATDETEDKKKKTEKNETPKNTDDNGFGNNERLTLRIDAIEAEKYVAKKYKLQQSNIPDKLNKKKKQVRQLYEEDDDELVDDDVVRSLRQLDKMQQEASNGDNSLLNALYPNERRDIMQQNNIEITRQEQNAGKHNALEQTDTLLRKANLRKMDMQEFMNEMQDAIYEPSRLRREALGNNIAKQMGIHGEIKKHYEGEVVKGVRKVKELTGDRQVNQLKIKDTVEISKQKMTQNQTAELILKKSGQTAKLTEIKMRAGSGNSKDKPKNNNQAYAREMKQLLKESLKKNAKIR